MIDLLWPLLLLMLRGFSGVLAGSLLGGFPLLKVVYFASEIKCRKPNKSVCPRIHEHVDSMKKLRFVARFV